MKIVRSKEWWLERADKEGNSSVGAGLPYRWDKDDPIEPEEYIDRKWANIYQLDTDVPLEKHTKSALSKIAIALLILIILIILPAMIGR